MRKDEELKPIYFDKLLNKLKEVKGLFDEEYRDVLNHIGYDSISATGRRRPVTFLRSMFCQLCNEICPIFERDIPKAFYYRNNKLYTQELVALVINVERSTIPHHDKLFDVDRRYFSDLFRRYEYNIKPKAETFKNDVTNILIEYNSKIEYKVYIPYKPKQINYEYIKNA